MYSLKLLTFRPMTTNLGSTSISVTIVILLLCDLIIILCLLISYWSQKHRIRIVKICTTSTYCLRGGFSTVSKSCCANYAAPCSPQSSTLWLTTFPLGLAYNGKDQNGEMLWNGGANVKLRIYEKASRFQHVSPFKFFMQGRLLGSWELIILIRKLWIYWLVGIQPSWKYKIAFCARIVQARF